MWLFQEVTAYDGEVGVYSSVAEHVFNMHEILGSVPSTSTKKKTLITSPPKKNKIEVTAYEKTAQCDQSKNYRAI